MYLAVDDLKVVILPNKSLTNFDLEDAAKKLNIPLRGVFCRNMLPANSEQRERGILNLDDSSVNGTHWTAWYKNGNTKFYFDSYGVQPPIEWGVLVRTSCHQRSPQVCTRSEVS